MGTRLPESMPSYHISQETPDGKMFVHICEHEGKPVEVRINIGKAGTNLAAWADASARLVTRLLPQIGIHDIIEELSGITSHAVKLLERGNVCRSGPEGLALALLKYRNEKFKENRSKERPDGARLD